MVNLPQHSRKISRRAKAPYNFVPLPEQIVVAYDSAENLPDHDTLADSKERFDGWIDVTLTTKSPVYIRAAMLQTQFNHQEKNRDIDGVEITDNTPFRKLVRNLPDFFFTAPTERYPVIPGSSLRGMLRNIFEIVTYSKIKQITKRKPVFRTLPPASLGNDYIERMKKDNIETGFIIKEGMAYKIVPCKMWRLNYDLLDNELKYATYADSKSDAGKTPNWRGKFHQHMSVWVQTTNNRDISKIKLEADENFRIGILVLTGHMHSKKHHYVFLLPTEEELNNPILVDEEIVNRFHDEDQISQWQQKAFPKDKPQDGSRKANGMLLANPGKPGDPVFFLRENGRLTFFGRAMMFRLPYLHSPRDLVPRRLRVHSGIDFTEAIFGYVRTKDELQEMGLDPKRIPQGDKQRAYAGRIYVTDAYPEESANQVFGNTISPRILSSPKPTTFQHYLTQDTDNERGLKHYDSGDTTIRGHKRYWLQGSVGENHIRETNQDHLDNNGNVKDSSTQHTQITPINPKNTFRFRVYFDQLDSIELGALLWAIQLPIPDKNVNYCHQIGMGKPFGMGAVQLQPRVVHIISRENRYLKLFSQNNGQTVWNDGVRPLPPKTVTGVIQKFETFMLTVLQVNQKSFTQLERIQSLLKMMEWHEQVRQQEYMKLDDFRRRPVLPHPLDV